MVYLKKLKKICGNLRESVVEKLYT